MVETIVMASVVRSIAENLAETVLGRRDAKKMVVIIKITRIKDNFDIIQLPPNGFGILLPLVGKPKVKLLIITPT